MTVGQWAGPAALASLLAALVPDANHSTYTSTRPADCAPAPDDVVAAFKARDLGVQQCGAAHGWRLFVVASDSNTWLELRSDAATWSSEEAVVYQTPIGLFPSAGGAGQVEWRHRPDQTPIALIFRVTAQQESVPRRRVSRLFVVRLEPQRACLIGRARTNDEARHLADSAKTCADP
jgi:hypothetical protein